MRGPVGRPDRYADRHNGPADMAVGRWRKHSAPDRLVRPPCDLTESYLHIRPDWASALRPPGSPVPSTAAEPG